MMVSLKCLEDTQMDFIRTSSHHNIYPYIIESLSTRQALFFCPQNRTTYQLSTCSL